MPSVTIPALIEELRGLYVPPFGAVATWKKTRQVLSEFARVAGVRLVSDLTPPAVGRWLLAFPGRTPATACTLLSSLRRACSYSVQCGYLRSSPFAFRKLSEWVRDHDPRGDGEERPDRHHPLASITRVLNHLAAEAPGSWEAHRLFALAATTFLTGARAREVQGSLADDFDLTAGIFRIRTNERRRLKTRRSKRRVVLPPELTPILAAWLPACGSRWAFPGAMRVGPWNGGAPGRKPLDRLKAAGRACGVEGFTYLSLRHSYVTHSRSLWRVPPSLTQQLCGHTSPETTEGYAGFDLANARASVGAISAGISPPALSA